MKREEDAPVTQTENLITPAGHRRIEDELNFLFSTERPKLVEEVAAAAAQGDRSENAEYIYGKKRLREIDKRMNFLKSRLDKAKVIDPALQTATNVQFGATVVIEDENGTKKSWTIIGEDEVDPSNGLISWKSPIGRAMLNKNIGDYFEAKTPKGDVEFLIISINYH
jgi:transcription elongation factor GreB